MINAQNTHKPQTFGWRIDRAGAVWAFTARARHGRLPQHLQIHAGFVRRDGRHWRNDQCSDHFTTQEAAARSLVSIVFGPDAA